MKTFFLLAMALPSVAVGIPIQLNGPDSDLTAFTSAGYRVEHSELFDRSTGFNCWWVSFFSAPGVVFDAQFLSGALAPTRSEILVQGENPDGDYYSQIIRLKPELTDAGLTTVNLDENFRNLSWLRISGFGLDCDFALNDVALTSTSNVPEPGPGILLMAIVLAGLAIVHARTRVMGTVLVWQRHRSRINRSPKKRP